MKIGIVGSFSASPDEAMRKTASKLLDAFESRGPVTRFDLENVARPSEWWRFRQENPDALLYIPGPSLTSFGLLRTLKTWTGASITCGLTLNPEGLEPAALARKLSPDILFTHSDTTRDSFETTTKSQCTDLMLGVDQDRFKPPSPAERREARRALSLETEDPVLLHVGHLKAGRNLEPLIDLVEIGEVVLVVSTATEQDEELRSALEEGGVRVIDRFLPDIERVFRASDLYVFPVTSKNNATEIPLSVLEALATGLPVAATPYGALSRLPRRTDGLRIVDGGSFLDAVASYVAKLQTDSEKRSFFTRSWSDVAADIEDTLGGASLDG